MLKCHTQVVQVHRQPFHCNSLLKCVLQPKIAKNPFVKNPLFSGSRSFKVIDVDKTKNSVTSACYDKQHICTYLQSFSRYTSQ